MKYKVSDKTRIILEHILYVAEKSSKTVQFCFTKGEQQYYITPKRDLLVSFKLDTPIKFDYPIANLKTFLSKAADLDSDKIKTNKDTLYLASKNDIREFTGKRVVQNIKFKLKDLETNHSLSKYKYLNIIGDSKNCVLRYQNHIWNWWFDDKDKKILPLGKSSRKFRYIIERSKLRLLPNNYQLILREDIIQFQLKHLNYYFAPEVYWTKQSVKDWVSSDRLVKDKDLIKRYKTVGLMTN